MASVRARRIGQIYFRSLVLLIALAVAATWYTSFGHARFVPIGDRLFALGFGKVDWWHDDDVPDGDFNLGRITESTVIPTEQISQFPGRFPLAVIWVGMLGWVFLLPILCWVSSRLSPERGRAARWVGGVMLALSVTAWSGTQFQVIHLRFPVVGLCGYIGSAWIGFGDGFGRRTASWGAGMEPTDYLMRSCIGCELGFIGHRTGGYPNTQVNFLWPALAGLGLWAIGRGARSNLEQQGLCPKCGYSRMGDSSARCPECGSPERPQGAGENPV